MVLFGILFKRFLNWFTRYKATGLKPQSHDARDYPLEKAGFSTGLSETVDLRPLLKPVKDQGVFESCTAFATGTLFDYVAHHKKKIGTWKDFDYSEAYQWYYTRLEEGTQLENTGVMLRNCFKTIMKHGFTTQEYWDFIDGYKTAPDDAARLSAEFYKLYLSQFNGYYSIYPGNTNSIKSVLSNGYPVVFGMRVNMDFTKIKGNTLIKTMPNPQYGHAMLIVGYNKDGFIVRNSWGPAWGDQGYCVLSEELIKSQAFDLWCLN